MARYSKTPAPSYFEHNAGRIRDNPVLEQDVMEFKDSTIEVSFTDPAGLSDSQRLLYDQLVVLRRQHRGE